MKPRVLRTYKILAVALTSTAACAPTVGATSGGAETAHNEPVVAIQASAPAQPQSPAPGAPESALAAAEPAPSADTPPAPSAPVPVPASAEDNPDLQKLRYELVDQSKPVALMRINHYRPLCDTDGYPLVGNVVRKGPRTELQPSALCAEVRRRAGR